MRSVYGPEDKQLREKYRVDAKGHTVVNQMSGIALIVLSIRAVARDDSIESTGLMFAVIIHGVFGVSGSSRQPIAHS
jgi:hypothetical protein